MLMNRFRLIPTLLLILIVALAASPTLAQSSRKTLPETYVSDDERLTLRYPAGWVIQADSPEAMIMGTSDLIFNFDDEVLPAGEAGLAMLSLAAFDDLGDAFPLGEDPLSSLELISASLFETDAMGMTIGTPEALSIADHRAARADGDVYGNPIFLLLVDYGDQDYIMFIGIVAPGEFAKFEPKLLAIAESVRYLPA
jgi:hypothetical protein